MRWKPSKVPGVEYIPLNTDAEERAGTFLLKMAPNTTYPKHRHPKGEEVLVLKGDMTVGNRTLKAGDFLYSPPGSIHSASTVQGCMFLTSLPEAIQIIPASKGDEIDQEIAVEASSGGASYQAPAFRELDIEGLPEPKPGPTDSES